MKTVRYFYRSYAVPGEAFLEPKRRIGVRNIVIARAHYRIYRRTKAVVYTGIDRTVPTSAMALPIISLISKQEQINPHDYSWFDLQTCMQDEQIDVGDYKFFVIFLRPASNPLQGEVVVLVECPKAIEGHFARYIYSELYSGDLTFSPDEFARWEAQQSGEDDDDDDDGRKEDEPARPNPPAPRSRN